MTDVAPGPHRSRGLLWATCLLAGCASAWQPGPEAADYPCFVYRRNHAPQRMCAAAPLPPVGLETQVMRSAPEAEVGQVLVQWVDRAGATRPLALRVDGHAVAELLPGTLVRVRLPPGEHALAVAWEGQQAAVALHVEPAAIYHFEIKGWVRLLAWGFEWEAKEAAGARQRAQAARLIADVDLRPLAVP